MIRWVSFDLQDARNNEEVDGAGVLLAAFTENATVTPQIIYAQKGGQINAVPVSLPIVQRVTYAKVSVTNEAGAGRLWVGLSADPCDAVSLSGGGSDPNAAVFFDAFWQPINAATPGQLVADRWLNKGVVIDAPPFWQSFQAGAGAVPQLNLRNIFGFQTRPNGGLSGLRWGVGNIPWQKLRNNAGAFGGQLNAIPDIAAQAWTIEFLWRKEQNIFTKTGLQGFFLIPAGGALPGMPSGNNACFGFTPGLGNMEFVTRPQTGIVPFDIQDAFSVPNGDAQIWNRAALQLINADETLGRDGVVRFWQNGVMLFEYRDMSRFPGTWDSGGAGTETGYAFVMTDDGAPADNLFISQTRVRSWSGEGRIY